MKWNTRIWLGFVTLLCWGCGASKAPGPGHLKEITKALASGTAAEKLSASNSLRNADSVAIPWLISQLSTISNNEKRSGRPYTSIAHYADRSESEIDGYPLNILPRHKPVLLAFGALGTNAHRAIPELLGLLSVDNSSQKQSAAVALGQIGVSNTEIINALKLLLSHQSQGVRKAALFSLAKLAIDSPDVREEILKIISREKTEDVLVVIAMALQEASRDYEAAAMGMVGVLKQMPAINAISRTGQLPITLGKALPTLLEKADDENLSSKVAFSIFEFVTSEQGSMPAQIAAASVLNSIQEQVPNETAAKIREEAFDLNPIFHRILRGHQ